MRKKLEGFQLESEDNIKEVGPLTSMIHSFVAQRFDTCDSLFSAVQNTFD